MVSPHVILTKRRTVFCPLCSRIRPWQVIICAPALSNILAYSTVFSTVGNTRNLAVTGIDRFTCRVLTAKGMIRVSGTSESVWLTELVYQLPIVLKKGPIASSFSDILRAPKVQIHGFAVIFNGFSRNEELFGIVCTKLDDKWSICRGVALFSVYHIEIWVPVGFVACVYKNLRLQSIK